MPVALTDLPDEHLLAMRLALQLACGRSHSTFKKRHRAWFCFLAQTLTVESDFRGLPGPLTTSHVGDLPPAPLAI
jgi:hypothetical protein